MIFPLKPANGKDSSSDGLGLSPQPDEPNQAAQRPRRNLIERKGRTGIYDFDYAGACRPTEDLLDGFVECVASARGDVAFLIGQATDASDPLRFPTR
jgi:hypothetical protein